MHFGEILSAWQETHGRLWSQELHFFDQLESVARLRELPRPEALSVIRSPEGEYQVRSELRNVLLRQAKEAARERFEAAHGEFPSERDFDLDLDQIAIVGGETLGEGTLDEWLFTLRCASYRERLRILGSAEVEAFVVRHESEFRAVAQTLKSMPLAVPTYSAFYRDVVETVPSHELSIFVQHWEHADAPHKPPRITLSERRTPQLVAGLKPYPGTQSHLLTTGQQVLSLSPPVAKRLMRAIRATWVESNKRRDWLRVHQMLNRAIEDRIGGLGSTVEGLIESREALIETDRQAAEEQFIGDWVARAGRALDSRPKNPPPIQEDWDRGVLPWWHYNR
jgi:hypothetical protein